MKLLQDIERSAGWPHAVGLQHSEGRLREASRVGVAGVYLALGPAPAWWPLPSPLWLPGGSRGRSACVAFRSQGIFDDPKLVADVKEAVATIKKVRSGDDGLNGS